MVDLRQLSEGERRHLGAVAGTLAQADEAAGRGDFATALSWLRMLEALGDEIPLEHRRKSRDWALMLDEREG